MKQTFFDAHCDTILRVADDKENILEKTDEGHIDIPRLQQAGVNCQVFACWASIDEEKDNIVDRSELLLTTLEELAKSPLITVPQSSDELKALKHQNEKTGVIFAIEGGEALGGDAGKIAPLKARGVRAITLAWGDNDLTGSAFGENRGLTPIGKEVVKEMDKHRMLMDASHLSDKAFYDLADLANGPIVATHSNCRTLCNTPRNLTDDQIRIIAERGGVIGVNFASGFLSHAAADAQAPIMIAALKSVKDGEKNMNQAFEDAYIEIAKTPMPPLSSVIDQIEHYIEIGGIGCAGFGSDFDGIKFGPLDMDDCLIFPTLAQMLADRGYSGEEIDQICWSNWERAFSWTFES